MKTRILNITLNTARVLAISFVLVAFLGWVLLGIATACSVFGVPVFKLVAAITGLSAAVAICTPDH